AAAGFVGNLLGNESTVTGLSVVSGKTFTSSNTLTLTGTDSSTLNIGTGGTLGSNAFTSTAFAPLTTPTFLTNITSPLVIGGTTITSPLILRSTSGVGTTGSDIIFRTGNNGSTEAMRILNNGNVGIGTTNPGELLSLGLAGTTKGVLSLAGNTSGKIIIQPQAAAGSYTLTLPATAGTTNQFLQTDGSGNLTWATGGGGSSSLSGLTAATTTNTIDNLNFAQTWNWSTANTQNPLAMNFNALTTGSALSLLTSNASLASTNGFLYVANTGVATGATPFVRFQPNSTAGSGITLTNAGNVGIGTNAPAKTLDIIGNLRTSSSVGIGDPTLSTSNMFEVDNV